MIHYPTCPCLFKVTSARRLRFPEAAVLISGSYAMKTRIAIIFLLASAIATAGADQRQDDDQIRVRVINALPGAGAISVSLGAQQLFSGTTFGQVTAYKLVPEQDDAQLAVTLPDGKQLRPDDDDELDDDGEDYTVLVIPRGADNPAPQVKLIEMDDDKPADIKTHVSLVNASATIDEVELGVDGNRIFSGVDRGDLAGPSSVDSGQKNLTVNQAGGQKSLLSVPLNIEPAKSYTVVVFTDQQVTVVDDSVPMKTLISQRASGTTATATSTTPTEPEAAASLTTTPK